MRLSDDKISHLTHIILRGLIDRQVINPLTEGSKIRREIKRIITKELKIAEDIDTSVRNKLESYSKKIYEGTSEWDVLYQKFFDEETAKKGRS